MQPIIRTSFGFLTSGSFVSCANQAKGGTVTFKRDKSFNGLEEDADSQGKKEYSVEKST